LGRDHSGVLHANILTISSISLEIYRTFVLLSPSYQLMLQIAQYKMTG
jgi:hypothetical protein